MRFYSVGKRLIFTGLMMILSVAFLSAHEPTAAAQSPAPAATSSAASADPHASAAVASPAAPLEAAHPEKAHTEGHAAFDPVEYIIHHVSDANEFHVVGSAVLPLPIIIYNKDKNQFFTALSSSFHPHHGEGTVEVDGYKMEHSRVHSADGSQIIDFSITKNVFTMLFTLIILFVVFFTCSKAYAANSNSAPKGIQGVMEPLFQFVAHDIARENIGKNYRTFVPFLVCVFFFILINNLIGLLPIFPGSANVTGNTGFTIVLAFFAFVLTNVYAKKDYWIHTFAMPGVPKALLLVLTPIEILGLFIKPASLALRLFGNIVGGHIAVLSIASIIFVLGKVGMSVAGSGVGAVISLPLLIFVNALELFVAFLQAYVFTLLSSIFIGIAQEEHAHH